MTPGLKPLQLDDALAAGLGRTSPTWRGLWSGKRYAIWLTRHNVLIGRRKWDHKIYDERGFGYSRRQAKQMRRALRPVIAGQAEAQDAWIIQSAWILASLDRDPAQ